jgi:hypothetical protein
MRAVTNLLLALPLLMLAGAAKADPGVEIYEATYLASCSRDLARTDCRCRMAVIEEALSQRLFAQLVARYGGDIREVLPDEAIAPQVRQRCGDAGVIKGGGTARSAAN